ncbi:MAG TPA: alpha/beta hydrolase [Gemmatimonadaceae bacterium]|nr:alpha/beta hydrolase [Gemmatimonadaceae bacterium]
MRAAALLAFAVSCASAQVGARRIMTSADLSSLTAPPPDHRIQYGPDPLQFGNLRLPKRPGPHPVVVFIHGGCWLSEYTIAPVAALEQAIADGGFAVWSLEYRRIGDEGGGWPGTFTDIARGADYLRVLAPQYALDLSRVVTSGHSAGGQFALWLAARKKIPVTSPLYMANPLAIRGVLALAPAPDLEGLHGSGICGKVIDRLMGGSPTDHPDRYAAASPMQLAPIALPQLLVIGAYDQAWAPIGRSYFARAQAAGDTAVHVIDAPESGHFEMIAPATTTWPLVISSLRALFTRIGR